MINYKKACKLVAEGFDNDSLKCGSKKYSVEESKILRNVLNVESKVFNIYIKNQKCNFKTFPFEEIKVGFSMDRKVAVLIAKLLFAEGWKPEIHAQNTRKRFENIPDYQRI